MTNQWKLTLINVNDIRMLDAAHDLHFASNAHQICVGCNLAFFYRFNRHLLTSFLVDAQLHFAVRALSQFLDDVETLSQFFAVIVHAHGTRIADAAHDVIDGGGLCQRHG